MATSKNRFKLIPSGQGPDPLDAPAYGPDGKRLKDKKGNPLTIRDVLPKKSK